ncbi:activator of basal transcription 1 [Brachionichthys hirsutus]|uniref:activator of basal transcription 1 n=1 Tax=Brachionichthys hirsutus TaxID=412623 RepID=UPI00360531C9
MEKGEEDEEGRNSSAQTEEEDDEEEEEEEDEEEVASERQMDKDDEDENAAGMKNNKRKEGRVTSCSDRKCVPGIVYLGHIPPRLRPKHLRNQLSLFGEIGRIFLQPEDRQIRRRKRKAGSRRCDFTEGWVEFRDKRVAKRVAVSLNNTPMGTRKRHRFFSDLWSIKYLHRFHWTHLNERLAYEQTVLKQRLRTEVSQAKRETNFYLNNVERSAHLDRRKTRRRRDGQQVEEGTWDFTQRQTEDEIQTKKNKKKKNSITQKHQDEKTRRIQQKSQSNVSLLAKIFNCKQNDG